ncbi:MAG: ATP-dependent Clp protease ATP-binding subunit ClpX [Lachnospiraceae bacterium]|nr:ATP-dependent Clp protease ATP-binding subunit ClpX [Lachnospiraceae bacterium]
MSESDNKTCNICHRNEETAGKMFSIPGGLNICGDCLHEMLDKMGPSDLNQAWNLYSHASGMPPVSPGTPADPKDTLEDIPINDTASRDETAAEKSTEAPQEPSEKDSPPPRQGVFGFPIFNFGDFSGFMPGRQKVKKSSREDMKKEFDFKKIPLPHKIKEQLDEYVIGQEQAKKIVSVAVYNHYKRVAESLQEDPEDIEIEKSNILMLGPTGCGKTYLVKTLARILDVPLAITDATTLTEAGYIGDDIESVVSKLLAAADNDVERAEYGIIFIDEIDKIAKKKNTNSRDVSGESVQQGMLKLLEGARIEVPVGANSKNAMVPLEVVDTTNILFICGGAFPELDEIIKQRLAKTSSIGFGAELKDKWDRERNILSRATVEDIKKFGMIPEFVGRLPIICALDGLSEDMLVSILSEPKNAILKQYKKLLSMDEVELKFTDGALHAIAKKALEKETGARALRAIIEEFMLDIMYEVPRDDSIGSVTITEEYINGTGGPVIDLRGVAEFEASLRPRLTMEGSGNA